MAMSFSSRAIVLLVLLATTWTTTMTLENGLARTPPMGWLSWAAFWCQVDCNRYPNECINEQLYMDMADRLASDGYAQAGYQFVNIDDCWMAMERDSKGKLQADKSRFPRGIPFLADYMHKKGLKLGIYEDYGTKTCGGYPGSLDYLELDAKTFAEWDVDMLKLDGCYSDITTMPDGYPLMGYYLNQTGRPIVYSCSWPAYEVGAEIQPDYAKIAKSCNLWRNYDDISPKWESLQSIINWYDHNWDAMAPNHGPGNWNDPDMILIGQKALSVDQAQTQMAIWSIWSAPLLMSNDLRKIEPQYKEILLNPKVIAIDQDPLGKMGKLVVNTTNVGIYLKAVTPVDDSTGDHSYAVVFFNRHLTDKANVTLKSLGSFGLTYSKGYFAENLFTGIKYGVLHPTDSFHTMVNPTGVVMLKLTLVNKLDGST